MSNRMCVCVRKLHSYVDWYLFLFFAKVITLFCKNVHTLKTICLVLEGNILPTFCHLIFLNSLPIFVGESNYFIVLHGRLWTALSSNVVFRHGDNFCKAFAGAQVHLSYLEWLRHSRYDICTSAPAKALQKLSPSRKAILI